MSTKETTAGHTALPWAVQSGAIWAGPIVDGWRRIPIAKADREYGNGTQPVERDENLALIVRAVNAHDELVNALTEVKERMDRHGSGDVLLKSRILAALAKAGGVQ